MSVNLPPVINPQYFDNNGLPLAGGKIYTYQAGTSTPQATYTDQSGGTPNTNPVVLDSAGRCSMWLDPSLSYKFVFTDSAGNTIKTVDNVVGLLTANAVTTGSIQDGAVTSSKLGAGAVNSAALASDSSVDSNRPVNTNNIRDSAITRTKLNSAALPVLSLQKFTSGSGTYNPTYVFFVSSANATSGATYTNNGQTFTVVNTISTGAVLQATGTGVPAASGTLTKTSGTGDASITFTIGVAPSYIRVRMVGGGGGGSGGGTTSTGGSGGAGGNTTFGTTLLVANGGSAPATAIYYGGAGGSASLGTGPIGVAFSGAYGGTGSYEGGNTVSIAGGMGGISPFGGAGIGDTNGSGAHSAIANTGSGGGGGGASNVGNSSTASGGGGGAGGYVDAIIIAPSTSYSYAVGAAGTAGAAGTNGFAGSAGGSGLILVEEYYQ